MDNQTSAKFNILSKKEGIENQPKVIQEAKENLFEVLDAQKKMINRNKFTKTLETNRYVNGEKKINIGIPAGKIKIWSKEFVIDETKYKDLLKKYTEAITSLEGKEKDDRLHELDILLSERMILDSGNMIEYNPKTDTFPKNRTAKEESQRAYDELSKLDAYQDKIERAVKLLGDEQHFIVKWTEEYLSIILKKIEENLSKESISTNTSQQEELEEKKKSLNKEENKETTEEMTRRIVKEMMKEKENLEKWENKPNEMREKSEEIDMNLCINRDNVADAISKARKNTRYPIGSIQIKTDKFVDIEKQKDFEEFKKKYIEAKDNEGRLKELDTEFAERIILNNPPDADISKKYYIQINNDEQGKEKEESELVKQSLRCRDGLKNVWYDVEYIKHKKSGIGSLEDKAKKRELSDIMNEIIHIRKKIEEVKSELDSKRLHLDEKLRVEKQEELKKLKQKAEKLEKDHNALKQEIDKKETKVYHIVKLKKTNEIPIPPTDETPIPPTKEEDFELNAVISDMGTDVHRERVSFETEEELRKKYQSLARYNLPARAYLFLSRWAKRKRMIKEKMAAMAGKAFSRTNNTTEDTALNDKTENASDRHELEEKNKGEMNVQVEKANTVSLQNPLVNNLCKEYLRWNINEAQFQADFNTIIDNDANIQNILRWKKITHIGTNILAKLNLQKARRWLSQLVENEFNAYLTDNNQSHISSINKAISDHITHNQTNPEFMKDYEDFLNQTPGSIDKLKQYFKHQNAIMQMKTNNIKMNIDILVKGKAAYQIDNKDRQKWLLYKFWKALDKLPRWAQTLGFVGISVGTGILTGWLGTVAAAAITTGVSASTVGWMNAIKKRTHYTKEQNTHEKDMVTDYRKEQAKLKEWQNTALNGKRYQRKTYKAKRQLALYDQTTQENIFISENITDTITDLASKVGKIDDAQKQNYMKKNLIQWWTRLKYYRDIWHNFLASNDKEKIEKDMRRLEKALILWANKLGKTLTDIETMTAIDDNGNNLTYATVKKDLESSYNKSTIQFKRERRRLATKYGIGTAALSAGMSLGMQYLMGTGVFSGKETTSAGSTYTTWERETFELGKHDLLDTGVKNKIYDTATSSLDPLNSPNGSTITFTYGGWTDAVSVIPWHLTAADYTAKMSNVISNIKWLWLPTDVQDWLIDHIKSQPWKSSWSTSNFTNDMLHGMRCMETIEQGAKSLADSWRAGNLNFNIAYNSGLDTIGTTTTGNALERTGTAMITVHTPWVPTTEPSSRWRFLQFPNFRNTFEKVKEEDKDRQKPAE